MPAPTPDGDLVTRIVAGLGAGYTDGTNVFRGAPRKPGNGVPRKAIFCLASGGPRPEQYTQGAGTTSEIRYTSVQVYVRGDVNDFATGQTLARDTRDAVHKATVSGYVNVEVNESEPTFLGVDDQECPRWSLNVTMWREV